MTKRKELQEVFAENFSRDDIEGAKKWIAQWQKNGQTVPGHSVDENDMYSVRAMSGHVSDYLEGFTGNEPGSYNHGDKVYLDTKYGIDMYNAAFDGE